MTRKEARIRLITKREELMHKYMFEEAEVLTMAIEALEQVTGKLNNPDDSLLTADSEACKEKKRKLDLISRAEAIEHFMRLSEDESLTPYTQMLMVGVSNELKKLPSADRPKDGDLISRQAAIDALYDKGSSMTAWGELLAMKWSDIQKCIEQLPSADRPRGEWVIRSGCYGVAYCSECDYELHSNNTNFCPNCGADMRGDAK